VRLRKGANPLVLRFEKPGRTHFVLLTEAVREAAAGETAKGPGLPNRPLAMTWWKNPKVLPFDVRASEPMPVGWYRFVSPPGLRGMVLRARGKVEAWAEGQRLTQTRSGEFKLPHPVAGPVTVWLRVEQERGCYAGAALEEPIRLQCGAGQMPLGDWSQNEGLLSYSGAAWYRKTVRIGDARQVWLDLGEVVSSAEVKVNGKRVGVRVSPPWRFDIKPFVRSGDNRIEVLVCNTLANHYTTVPTGYRGPTLSGLLGPVRVELR
jgi:hypothetical protein